MIKHAKESEVECMKVLVPLAEGFEEIEALTVVDILRRAGVEVVTAGLKEGLVKGSHGVWVRPDTALDRISEADFDAIVLPGGFPGFVNLGQDDRIMSMIQEMNRAGRCIAAICGAPSVLIRAGVLEGRRATAHPSGREEMMAHAEYCEDSVVVDGNIITSRGPGTAMQFALKLVEVLAGPKRRREVQTEVLVTG